MILLTLLLALPACDGSATEHVHYVNSGPPSASEPENTVIPATFSDIYQIFLRRTLSTQEKSTRWIEGYKDRWVRWTGMLVAISPSGLKMRQLRSTLTFDVSVVVNQPQRDQLRKLLAVGKFYTYMGRLDRYDDLFHTVYLDQCVVLHPDAQGVPGQLQPTPPPLRLPAGPRNSKRSLTPAGAAPIPEGP